MHRSKTALMLGQWVSFGCVIHCVITPLLVMFLPTLGRFFESHLIEILFLVVSILAGMGVIYSGVCTHKKYHTFYLFALGAICWSLHFFLEDHDHFGFGTIALVVGSCFVLTSYYINHYYLKCCAKQPCCAHE